MQKVAFIKTSFDIHSTNFPKLLNGINISIHEKNSVVFEKGDVGEHFFIVLEGVYCVETDNLKEGKKEKQIYY